MKKMTMTLLRVPNAAGTDGCMDVGMIAVGLDEKLLNVQTLGSVRAVRERVGLNYGRSLSSFGPFWTLLGR